MKTDIIDRIDQALAENRQVKQQRMQAHVMWLLDNPTQLPITHLGWDETTTAITDRDLDQSASAAAWLWKFDHPDDPAHPCVTCFSYRVAGDYPWCGDGKCMLFSPESFDLSPEERHRVASAGIDDLPQPLHRGHVHIRPMVSDR